MPYEFKLFEQGIFFGEYTCRESMGDALAKHWHQNNVMTAIARQNDPVVVRYTLRQPSASYAFDSIIPTLLHHMNETNLAGVDVVARAVKLEWPVDYPALEVETTGPMAQVYVSLWWSVLFARLLLIDIPQDTGLEQITKSSEQDLTWYKGNRYSDKENAETAWKNRAHLNALALLFCGVGPVRNSHAITALKYYTQ
jgi:hypothetical protein